MRGFRSLSHSKVRARNVLGAPRVRIAFLAVQTILTSFRTGGLLPTGIVGAPKALRKASASKDRSRAETG